MGDETDFKTKRFAAMFDNLDLVAEHLSITSAEQSLLNEARQEAVEAGMLTEQTLEAVQEFLLEQQERAAEQAHDEVNDPYTRDVHIIETALELLDQLE